MIKVTASEARKRFAAVVKGARKGERYLIQRHDKGIAAVVPVEDLELLEEIERRSDLRAAREGLKELERESTIPWDQVKAELGL
jgi:prevent-host-death family protein